MLGVVREFASGYGWGSSDPHVVFTVYMYLFVHEMQRLSFFSYLNNNHIITKGKRTVNSFPNL